MYYVIATPYGSNPDRTPQIDFFTTHLAANEFCDEMNEANPNLLWNIVDKETAANYCRAHGLNFEERERNILKYIATERSSRSENAEEKYFRNNTWNGANID